MTPIAETLDRLAERMEAARKTDRGGGDRPPRQGLVHDGRSRGADGPGTVDGSSVVPAGTCAGEETHGHRPLACLAQGG